MNTNDNTEPCPTCSMAVNKSAIKLAARVAELEAENARLRHEHETDLLQIQMLKLLVEPRPSVCTPALDVTSQHTPRSGAMLGARASDAASDLEKLAAEWLDKWVYTEPDDQPNLVPVLVRLLKSVRDGACSETAEPEWLETMKQRTRAAEEYARSRDFTSTLPDGEPEKKA